MKKIKKLNIVVLQIRIHNNYSHLKFARLKVIQLPYVIVQSIVMWILILINVVMYAHNKKQNPSVSRQDANGLINFNP